MKRFWWLGALLILSLNASGARGLAAEERQLVLVSAVSSKITPLSPIDVRRLFLGLPIIQNNARVEAVHNASDPLLTEVFLQKIIFMSAQNYERQLMERVFRSGGHRPIRHTDADKLIATLQDTPSALSYMWLNKAEKIPGIKVVQELWQGQAD